MNWESMLSEEEKKWKMILRRAESDLQNAPEGKLRVSKGDSVRDQYYYLQEDEKNITGKYLNKENMELIQKLAQKEYAGRMYKLAETRLAQVEKMKRYAGFGEEQVTYRKLPPAKRKLVVPYLLTDEEYIAAWRQQHIGQANPFPIEKGYDTNRGETVRSRIEKIIADHLNDLGIPYVYEPAVILKNYKILYPDFLLLNCRTRETFYYEHFGMMDSESYSSHTVEKLALYAENEIWPGENLLFTMEAKDMPVNLEILDALLQKYLF